MANGVVNEKYYVYERSHTYSDELEYTSTHHMQVCTVCDYETAIVQHSYVITYTAQNHTTSCADCNYRSTMNHSYTVTHTAQNHTRSCRSCSWSVTEPHAYDSLNTKCTICGRPASNTPVQPFQRKIEKVTMHH